MITFVLKFTNIYKASITIRNSYKRITFSKTFKKYKQNVTRKLPGTKKMGMWFFDIRYFFTTSYLSSIERKYANAIH